MSKKKRLRKFGLSSSWEPKLFLLPPLLYLLLVTQVPFVITLYYSTQSWNMLRPDIGIKFVGFQNYVRLLSDPVFLIAVKNTFFFTGAIVVSSVVFGLPIAILMNRDFPLRGLCRTLIISPFLVMPTISPIIWKNMIFHPVFGLLPYLFSLLKISQVDMIAKYSRLSIIIITAWQWIPFMMLILLAGMQSLPKEITEAARIDGANATKEFFYIVLPHLRVHLLIGALLEIILILPLFDQIFMTTYGGPGFATINLMFDAYRVAFQEYQIGAAASLGVINVIIIITIGMLLVQVLKRVKMEV